MWSRNKAAAVGNMRLGMARMYELDVRRAIKATRNAITKMYIMVYLRTWRNVNEGDGYDG